MSNNAPDEESYPLAAQIPLKSFTIPTFPPHASRLRELTVTADIKLDEYQLEISRHAEHQQAQNQKTDSKTHARRISDEASSSLVFHAPNLPASITSLNLELFSLGFPAGWLGSVANSLKGLKSLVMFACLIDGIDEGSRADVNKCFEVLQLVDLHFIDSFARHGFWTQLAQGLKQTHLAEGSTVAGDKNNANRDSGYAEIQAQAQVEGQPLQFLEMSYTYRGHTDPDFMGRLCGEEIPELLGKGLVAASFNLLPPPPPPEAKEGQESLEDPANLDDKGELFDNKRPEGILPFQVNSRATDTLVKRFAHLSTSKDLAGLKMLNLSMWTLRPGQVGEVLESCAAGSGGELADLCISVSMDDGWWEELLKSLKGKSGELEGLEIVGVPSDEGKDMVSGNLAEDVFGKTKDHENLRLACPKLTKVEMSILRAASFGKVEWALDEASGTWKGGMAAAQGQNGNGPS